MSTRKRDFDTDSSAQHPAQHPIKKSLNSDLVAADRPIPYALSPIDRPVPYRLTERGEEAARLLHVDSGSGAQVTDSDLAELDPAGWIP